MFKESCVWVDAHRRSIHWYVCSIISIFIQSDFLLFLLTRGKTSLDAANSKFLLLDSAVSSPAALPAHLQPLGEFKGSCRDVELSDSVTFRLILTTGKLFEAKVRLYCPIGC